MDALTDWSALYTTVAAVLPAWDAWCPDDGRPATALAAAAQYVATPDPVARLALETALAALQPAWLGALRAEDATLVAGLPLGPVAGAQDAAFAVLSLGHSLLAPSPAERAANQRNVASHAALAARWLGQLSD